MTRTELIIQLLKIAIGLAFGAYFVSWSLEVLGRLTPEYDEPAAMIGPRIMKFTTVPVESLWLWTLALHQNRTPTHGYEATREATMAAFAKSWRRQ